jgi:hypothetical protein
MTTRPCPICSGPLELRDVAPCAECGGAPVEVDHFLNGYAVHARGDRRAPARHTYGEWELFPGLRLILCDICHLELSGADRRYFGENAPKIDPFGIPFIRTIHDTALGKDLFCPACHLRLAFLTFLAEARTRYS